MNNQERAQQMIAKWVDDNLPYSEENVWADEAIAEALADDGLLIPDEDERLPSWVYDHPDVCTNPHRMGGQPCIRGTRVPVDIIFNLMDGPDGCTDEEIAEFYPSVPTDAINRLRIAREEHNNG